MEKYDPQKKRVFWDACRAVAADGAVLLKNEGNVLPVREENVSVFGRTQINYYRSGTGSGGAVNAARKTNLLDALSAKEQIHVNEKLAQTYRDWVKEHPFDNGGGGWAAEPWHQEEMPLTEEIVAEARKFSEKAIVVIGRTAGEDADNADEPGGYRLTETEREMLRLVTGAFEKVAVVLNVANIIDMTFVEDPAYKGHIRSILYAWQGGQEGGLAAADVLTGDVNPGGKLTDTIARSIADYPSSRYFGGEKVNVYEEDIYVGYRYFETFCPEKVLYPFGFGLSYTTFALTGLQAHIRSGMKSALADTVQITLSVTNTGKVPGREVVQVYYNAPQEKLGKPLRQLVSFRKTDLLYPMESQEIELLIPVTRMASFDDSGVTGYRNAWVLEQGRYRFYVGTSVRDVEKVNPDGQDGYPVVGTALVEQLEEACAPEKPFERLKPVWTEEPAAENPSAAGSGPSADGVGEMDPETAAWMADQKERSAPAGAGKELVPVRTVDLKERIESELPASLPITGDKGYTLRDVRDGKVSLDDFTAQLDLAALETIVRGEGMCSGKVTPGTAAAFGGVSDALAHFGIPAGCCSDGPSGIRQDDGSLATQMPIGTLLASTWDPEAVTRLYQYEGEELREKEIDSLLGPGMNIHRHPLNGRNFEYFSEDPLVTAVFAASCLSGIKAGGSDGTIKHFACNSQEKARRTSDSRVSQRALREIYLRAFEFAVKEAGADSVMTAYNRLNGFHCSSDYELTETILRKQWGFRGQVMTDWFGYMGPVLGGEGDSVKDTASMVRAGNDLYMVVHNNSAEINEAGDNLDESLVDRSLTIGELQRSAENILSFLLHSPCMDREVKTFTKPKSFAPDASLSGFPEAAQADASGSIYLPADMERGNVFEVRDDADFDVLVVGSYKAAPTAQSAAAVFVNGESAPMVSMSGNGPDDSAVTEKYAYFRLKKGFYHLTYKVTKGTMRLHAFYLKPVQ